MNNPADNGTQPQAIAAQAKGLKKQHYLHIFNPGDLLVVFQ
ncbi:hypothetical protein OQJ18_11760 [Fluoribacter dumoffii]|nr:hypothetical protein [Fluoribacter dumoffii]MCW8454928.1 hypothetical protein [Fluoribacter dumoffii]MCW8460995.1 hypothetical protein [Fluoribacter dumoffii]